VAEVSERLRRRVLRDYGPDTAARVLRVLAEIPETLVLAGRQDPERLQAAAVVGHDGTWESVERRLRMLRRDWRDALVAAGLAQLGWPRRLDADLGPR
jgi:hypothetical protein